jgi:hypothetical protein
MKNERIGMFTSSKISDLTTNGRAKGEFGKPFYTLCEEKAMEVILNRGLENDMRAPATDWGTLCESFAFQLLPLDYAFNVKRYTHLNLPWSGIPDSMSANHVGDIKCPFTLKSAFGLSMLRTGEQVREHAPWYYWQLVSNAILCNRSKAELDIFVPKITRAKEIMEKAVETESLIRFKTAAELPFLPVDSDFPELTRIAFEIPESDMLFLESRIIAATEERNAKIDEYRKLFAI